MQVLSSAKASTMAACRCSPAFMTYLIDVFRSVTLEINRAPDLEVGLTIQVCGLDEADLQPFDLL